MHAHHEPCMQLGPTPTIVNQGGSSITITSKESEGLRWTLLDNFSKKTKFRFNTISE